MEIVIGILGLFIAWLTYVKTFHAKPNEEMQIFLAQSLATQKLSKEVSEIISNYAIKHNAFEVELYKGVTYRSYLKALEDSQATNLSDDL